MTRDNEIPDALLSCERRGICPDNSRSVSESVQTGDELAIIWCRNIFAENPPGPQSADQAKEVSGKVGMLAVAVGTRSASDGAGVAAADEVNGNSSCLKSADVGMDWGLRPKAAQDGPRGIVDLAEGCGLKTACALKAEREAADAREKIEDSELAHDATTAAKASR